MPPVPAVQRQIALPLSKAVEIAYKSIRMRLSRSLLVTSGIVLALAFLSSILATQTLQNGMRDWLGIQLKQRTAMANTITSAANDVRNRIAAAGPAVKVASDKTSAADSAVFKDKLGIDPAAIVKDLGQLPAPAEQIAAAMTADSSAVASMQSWLAAERAYAQHRQDFGDAQALEQMMTAKGVPINQADVDADRTQTHWLVALALMVAFVGILNAMLMSVTERFREIGTMKCLGALNSFIVKLFLIESLFQGGVGTIVGIGAGLSLSFLSMIIGYQGYALKNLQGQNMLMGVGFCLIIGVGLTVGGALYPAMQAARMQPIEAMRADV